MVQLHHDERKFPPTRQTRECFGFTLIEILVTVAIMGVASALVIPFMTNMPSFETEGAARQIVADLSYAQSDAMARQTKRRILFAADGSGYRLLGGGFVPDQDELYDPIAHNGDQRYIVNFTTDERFQNVSIESAVFDSGYSFITYDELGGPIDESGGPSTGGTIVVKGKNEKFQISVSPFTGRVSVTKL